MKNSTLHLKKHKDCDVDVLPNIRVIRGSEDTPELNRRWKPERPVDVKQNMPEFLSMWEAVVAGSCAPDLHCGHLHRNLHRP